MPLRARLRQSGLKLKIPVRPSSAVSSSPYAGGNRHSASPGRRAESRTRPPAWPSEAPKEVPRVQAFDASVDSRPVWDVSAERLRTTTDGFRSIPIQYSTAGDHASSSPELGQGSPVTPELASINPQFRSSPLETELELLSQRARRLRDWFHRISPGGGGAPEQRDNSDISCSSYSYSTRYLSSPVPTFRSRSRLSPAR